MIIKNTFSALLLFGLFCAATACGPRIMFEEPLPPGEKDGAGIPKKYWGLYFSDEDSVFLRVEGRLVSKIDKGPLAEPLESVTGSDGYYVKNGLLFGPLLKAEGEPVTLRNDSIFGNPELRLDILNLDAPGYKLRSFKKDLVLNKYHEKDSLWEVIVLRPLKNGVMECREASISEDLSILQKISDVRELAPADTAKGGGERYRAKIDGAQFKYFMKQGGFGEVTKYEKVKM